MLFFWKTATLPEITLKKIEIYNDNIPVKRDVELVDMKVDEIKKGGFPHFMLKEIFEQPQAYYNSLRAVTKETLPCAALVHEPVTLVACGSSYHAGLIFRYLVEEACTIPARVEFASEFKYFPPPIEGLVIGITQSGETADTISALRQAKTHNCKTLAITNVLGSSVSRIADHTLLMRAGPEIQCCSHQVICWTSRGSHADNQHVMRKEV